MLLSLLPKRMRKALRYAIHYHKLPMPKVIARKGIVDALQMSWTAPANVFAQVEIAKITIALDNYISKLESEAKV